MDSPVLFIVFNRPRCTRKVFQQIRKAQPKHLFISGDGPRPNIKWDAKNCAKVRDIVSAIDWDCDCRQYYQEQNLGCAKAVSGAINWFFDQVDQGIILEDDTVPSVSFFNFAAELLEKYKNHHDIMHIAGTNITPSSAIETSYLISRLIHIGGWATWKRAWQLFDPKMKDWQRIKKRMAEKNIFGNMTERYINALNRCYQEDLNVWGPKWSYTCLANDGLSIIPGVNLIYNIGYGPGAVHTKQLGNPFAHIKRSQIKFPLKHPSYMAPDIKFDESYLNNLFSVPKKPQSGFLQYRHKIQSKINSFVKRHFGLLN
jgi:hypothetical protein